MQGDLQKMWNRRSGGSHFELICTGEPPVLRIGAAITVVFRSAKERPFAERKATMRQ